MYCMKQESENNLSYQLLFFSLQIWISSPAFSKTLGKVLFGLVGRLYRICAGDCFLIG